jgi:hypothetical protein
MVSVVVVVSRGHGPSRSTPCSRAGEWVGQGGGIGVVVLLLLGVYFVGVGLLRCMCSTPRARETGAAAVGYFGLGWVTYWEGGGQGKGKVCKGDGCGKYSEGEWGGTDEGVKSNERRVMIVRRGNGGWRRSLRREAQSQH